MNIISSESRTVKTKSGPLVFTLERKQIKNINLRIRHDGQIYVSASPNTPIKLIDDFVSAKHEYIINAVNGFKQIEQKASDMKYVSGENVTLLGKNLRLNIVKDSMEYVSCDGIYITIHTKRPEYFNRKKNLLNRWINDRCNTVFAEIIKEIHKKFVPYGVGLPNLRIRNMNSRWGSCLPTKGIITLNRRLIEAPKNCIEYVVYHEFCHFIHPNHSKQFYSLLQVMLPDWKESKLLLENTIIL